MNLSSTPLPWKQQYLGGSSTILAPSKPRLNGDFPAYGYDEKLGFCIAAPFFDETIGNLARTDYVIFNHDDASLIVKAVNAHEDMIAALRPFALQFGSTYHNNDVLSSMLGLTIGDCRRALSALEKAGAI